MILFTGVSITHVSVEHVYVDRQFDWLLYLWNTCSTGVLLNHLTDFSFLKKWACLKIAENVQSKRKILPLQCASLYVLFVFTQIKFIYCKTCL